MKRALISVYHKENIDKIGRLLVENDWEILSTGGTARFLKAQHIPVTEVSQITQFPEILDGRVKTLHPMIFASILAKSKKEHLKQLEQLSLSRINLVIVNYYPFEDALAKKEKGLDFMLENIDIGGPSMVRAAAKNFKLTIVIVDEKDYLPVVETLVKEGDITISQRKRLAMKAFAYTSFYDSLIAGYLHENEDEIPEFLTIAGRKVLDLRYGENPHQKAALYMYKRESPLYKIEKLQGKELSYNNILDLSMVYDVLKDFQKDGHFSVIVKHQNPCGAALSRNQKDAFEKAFTGDSKSAFGGIVGFNKKLEAKTAEVMKSIFFEVIIAPDFSEGALRMFKKKKNLRLVRMPFGYIETEDYRTIPGGFVYQEKDNHQADSNLFELKTSRKPTPEEREDIAFGWKLIKFVKSNGIVVVKDRMLVGVGAGQMSRVDAVELAIHKAQTSLEGGVLLSDAFFPFADSVQIAAKNKIKVVVEPGGSIRDQEVIDAAEKKDISLLFTGHRHFRH